MDSRPSAANAWIAVALVIAGAAIAIELLAIFGQLPGRWGTIGGSLVVLALALSVIGRRVGRPAPSREPTTR